MNTTLILAMEHDQCLKRLKEIDTKQTEIAKLEDEIQRATGPYLNRPLWALTLNRKRHLAEKTSLLKRKQDIVEALMESYLKHIDIIIHETESFIKKTSHGENRHWPLQASL